MSAYLGARDGEAARACAGGGDMAAGAARTRELGVIGSPSLRALAPAAFVARRADEGFAYWNCACLGGCPACDLFVSES